MAQPTDSFKQFNYSLRPSKQVERKIMIEVLLRLSKAGYTISDYRYLGFGSPYYVDFVMFHKYLFMKDMVCVEWGEVPKRMKFNKQKNSHLARSILIATFITALILLYIKFAMLKNAGLDGIHTVVMIFFVFLFAMIPGGVAHDKKHNNEPAIWVLSILFGWSGIGWVIALVWAVSKPAKP